MKRSQEYEETGEYEPQCNAVDLEYRAKLPGSVTQFHEVQTHETHLDRCDRQYHHSRHGSPVRVQGQQRANDGGQYEDHPGHDDSTGKQFFQFDRFRGHCSHRQVDEGEEDHPEQVDEMPVARATLEYDALRTSQYDRSSRAGEEYPQHDQTDNYVK